ncbi:DHRS1-like protein [Mya arenaria]|uniref:DHRS1-like protein n=1 Tax=Mya arenaria TaxID=6604 RepID=A0ABY7FBM4_MYAAR|nr:DHRS1-like protein [Mya arenaria]
MAPLNGKVCIVTGATRGIGKGIALQLAEKGAKVYITGRTLDPPKDSSIGGSLRDTAREIEARGGTCIPVQCDHSNDKDIEQLFETVKRENDGRLDILVNNAYSAVNAIFSSMGKPFYEQPTSMWDTVNNVGLRNHYICSVLASRLMVPRKQGLIVNISSAGGLRYLFNAAYGIGKEACDRMAADCGFELRKQNVAFVSLWPGAVGTETVLDKFGGGAADTIDPENVPQRYQDKKKMLELFQKGETPEFAGQCIAALASDPDVMPMSGKILTTFDLGQKYGLQDAPGHAPMDMRSIKLGLLQGGYTWIAALTPGFVRVPKWLLSLVCIVTGATRGIGKGIALQLAEKGAKVYITGRTLDPVKGSKFGGSLKDTAREIEARGGTCIPIQCDHSEDAEIERLFDIVKRENDNRLDVLVNNAYSAANTIFNSMGVKFWDLPPSMWDEVNNVGLRNHYVCSVYAAKIMVQQKSGLIVNISSGGGLKYVFNCAYGIGKEACDRMAADCGFELRKFNVAFISLWPGFVGTETVLTNLSEALEKEPDDKRASTALENFSEGETPEFVGQCVSGLAVDPDIMKMSGKIVFTCDLARKYGLHDIEGHVPSDFTQFKFLLNMSGYKRLAAFVPGFLRFPKWILCIVGNKFY